MTRSSDTLAALSAAWSAALTTTLSAEITSGSAEAWPARCSQHASCPTRQRSPVRKAAASAGRAIRNTASWSPLSQAASARAGVLGAYQGSPTGLAGAVSRLAQASVAVGSPERRSSKSSRCCECCSSRGESSGVARTSSSSRRAAGHSPCSIQPQARRLRKRALYRSRSRASQ